MQKAQADQINVNNEIANHELERLSVYAKRLETLLKNLPGMSYRCLNLQYWPMDFVSGGCYDLCGYTRHEIENQQVLWGEFTHPDDVALVEECVRAGVAQNQPFEVEYRIISKQGVEKWVWERGREVEKLENGVGVLEGFISDITRIKNTETELINAKAYADAIVESAAEGIITVDQSGKIEFINSAALTIFDYAAVDLIHENYQKLIAEKHCQKIECFLDQQSGVNHQSKLSFEMDGIKSDGSVFPAQISISKVNNSLTNIFVILIRDLTVRRAAEREAREHRELLAHADRLNTLGEMSAAIAHEINQPLSAITIYAKSGLKFLDKDTVGIDRVRDVFTRLSAQAHRAGAVMERMQNMTTRRDSVQEMLDPVQLVEEAHNLAEPDARVRDFVIRLVISEDLPWIRCDAIQIQQVILNLLRNGMESMRSAGRNQNSEIIIRLEPNETGVKLSIEDCGFGLTPELSKQLFLPFVSTKTSGMGLGLTISRSIISAHGSKLEFKNNRRGGATFFFSLFS